MITFEQAQEIVARLYKEPWYKPEQMSEYRDWWYFPVGYIGSLGVIVDKVDGHFNILGSAFPFEVWLWGHRRGFKHDTYDLVITEVNDYAATEDFISGLGLRYPTVNSSPVAWYDPERVKSELGKAHRVFQDQRLGLKIPLFKEIEGSNYFEYDLVVRSCENEGCPF